MKDAQLTHKLKIQLSDYDCKQDIVNRLLLAELTPLDLEILEEILYSSIKIPLENICCNVDLSIEEVLPSIEKLEKTQLFQREHDILVVDKEMRKYFEFQITRFDNDFKPDMEFAQKLLKVVPIQLLPSWYIIPRTSNNIFESIIEKFLITPQVYVRHLKEIKEMNELYKQAIELVYQNEDYTIEAKDLRETLGLSKEDFEQLILYLEFCFCVCSSYRKQNGRWVQVISPFYEWKDYLLFLKKTDLCSRDSKEVTQIGTGSFCFVEAMTKVIQRIGQSPTNPNHPEIESMGKALFHYTKEKMKQVVDKLCLLRLALIEDNNLVLTDLSQEFLSYDNKDKAVFVYKHRLNRPFSLSAPQWDVLSKYQREAEKTLERALNCDWVLFDEFIKGVINPFSKDAPIILEKKGKSWDYRRLEVGEEEKKLLYALIFEVNYEASIVDIGTIGNKPCFCLTNFGKSFFEA